MVTGNLSLGFLRWARETPSRPALCGGECQLDYAGLGALVLTQAARLREAGVLPGDVVGVACDRSLECVVGILAALIAGAAYLPLDLGYPPARLVQMVEDAQPRLLQVRPGLPASMLPNLSLPMVEIAGAAGAALAAPIAVDDGAPAYVLFTSGSTGRPKGAVLSRRALHHMVEWHLRHPRLCRSARTLQFATFGFDASVQDLFTTLAAGGSLLLAEEADRRDPFRLLQTMRQERIERAFLPSAELYAVANAHAEGGALPESLTDLLTGGEALTITPALRTMFAALPGAVLYNGYGPTESCVLVTSRPLAGDPWQWPDRPDIGDPLQHARLYVADEQLRPVPDGIEGELLIGGPSLADGYIGNPGLSAERFVQLRTADGGEERVYRSGDRVRRDADGRIAFLGRDDDQVKIAGYRVELGEVEAALVAHPLVRSAAVVAPAGEAGRRLVAHVVPAADAPEEAELRALLAGHLADGLPPFARPHRLVFHQALPLTTNGKLDRRRLLEESGSVIRPAPASADAPMPERLVVLWRELLGQPALGIDDNVFEHGADSLLVMGFVTRLRAEGIDGLGAASVYEFPTARGQSQALAGVSMAAGTAIHRPTQRGALAQLRDRHRKVNR